MIIIAICVTVIYDARRIAEHYFSTTDKNNVIGIIKVIAFLICIISAIGLYYCMRG
jgi:hypothetical protein